MAGGNVYRYVTGTGGAGLKDGSSWANAAPFSAVDTLVAQVRALLPDATWQGAVLVNALFPVHIPGHNSGGTYALTNGGFKSNAITVRGSLPDLYNSPADAVIYGDRMKTWDRATRDTLQGAGVWDITGNDLTIRNFTFDHLSFILRLGGTGSVNRLTVEDCTARQFRRFLDTLNASLKYSTIRRCSGIGFSKHAFQIGTSSCWNKYQFIDLDSQSQSGDNFATAFHFDDTAHDELVQDCNAANFIDNGANDAGYWQGDGFCSESGTYNITFERCYAENCNDGGFDLKTLNYRLIDCGARRCKKSLRSWNAGYCRNFKSWTPRHPDPGHTAGSGGGQTVHIWHDEPTNGPLVLEDCTFYGEDSTAALFQISSVGSAIQFKGNTRAYVRSDIVNIVTTDNGAATTQVTNNYNGQVQFILHDPVQAYGTITPGAFTTADNGSGSGGTGLSINKPTCSVGDVLVLQVYAGASGTINTPSGWTAYNNNYFNSGANQKQGVFYRVVDGTEPSSWTVTHQTSTTKMVGGITAYSGVDTSSPIITDAVHYDTTAGTSHVSTAITAPISAGLLVYVTALQATTTATVASPLTEKYDVTSSAGSMAIERASEPWTGGFNIATNVRTITSSASARAIVTTLFLRPLPA